MYNILEIHIYTRNHIYCDRARDLLRCTYLARLQDQSQPLANRTAHLSRLVNRTAHASWASAGTSRSGSQSHDGMTGKTSTCMVCEGKIRIFLFYEPPGTPFSTAGVYTHVDQTVRLPNSTNKIVFIFSLFQ